MSRVHEFRFRGQHYTVTTDGARVTVTTDDGTPVTVDAMVEGDTIATNGGRTRWAAARTADGVWVCVGGYTAYLELADADHAAEGAGAANEVRAPMTGTVVSVAVESGATVAAGQVLVVLTAMKMEYKLEAPRDGTVARIGCEAGAQVELGQVLVALTAE